MKSDPISPGVLPELLLLSLIFLASPGDSLHREPVEEPPATILEAPGPPPAASAPLPGTPPPLHPWVLWWEPTPEGPVVWECFPVFRGAVAPNRDPPSSLALLPGIGPTLADRIVLSREREGPFAELADLRRVSGIGPVKLEGLRGHVALP